mgnify:CR=1 FL=1
MERSGLQRIIPIVLILIVIVAAVAGLVSVAQSMFFSEVEQPASVNITKKALTKTGVDRGVRMTVRGSIVGNEDFNSYSITVSPSSRNMTAYVGYLDKPISTKKLGNNTRAYEQFVYALDNAGYMDGAPLTGDANDVRGICATGELYTFEVLNDSKPVQTLWTSTCKNLRGSFTATRSYIAKLFNLQIPQYTQVLSKIDL